MLSSATNTWKTLSFTQRASLLVIAAVAFGGIILVGQVAARPSYGVLFSGLEATDAGAVADKLKDLKVEYRLSQGGRTIEVPDEKVYDLRLAMAAEGLPRGGSAGFELFDKTNFGATDFTQRLNYQRALQGELTRTINKLDGVVDSRVHIAIPEHRLFTDKDEPPTASVVLHLRAGHQLAERDVNGITHLVASAVEGMKTENVTVLDERGSLLSGSTGGGSPLLTDSQIQLQERYESRIASELQRLADQVLGPNKAGIRVSADLNWDKTETTKETYSPSGDKKNLPVEEQSTVETYAKTNAPNAPARGVPGVTGNTTQAGAQPTAQPGQYLSQQTGNKYVVNKIVEHSTTAPGKVRRISVAVLLDAPISPEQQTSLKNAFAAGAGLDLDPAPKGRGDKIELVSIPFDKSVDKAAAKTADVEAKQSSQREMIRNGSAVGVAVIMVIATFLMMKRSRKPRPMLDALIVNDTPPPALGPGPATYEPVPVAVAAGALPTTSGAPIDRIRQMSEERPEEVARQLASWMGQ